MKPISVWAVFGTRPEAIKMLPLVHAMKKDPRFSPTVCVTAQHREILDQVMDVFDVKADIDLNIMQPGQTLGGLTTRIINKLGDVLEDPSAYGAAIPDRILVHGDTTTTMATSLSSYYQQIPVGHVEAGLRTFDLYSPFPEEGNRQITRVLADLHFAPTTMSKQNLLNEGVEPQKIALTGNTVIDALMWMKEHLQKAPHLRGDMGGFVSQLLSDHERYLLVTGHRRENHGEGFARICAALREIAETHPETAIVYPVHPNPAVRKPVEDALGDLKNVHLIPPQDYAPFIYLMMHSTLILTDSGGVQEEAPSLGKPVLVMRDVTERQEAVEAGTVRLVGSKTAVIVDAVNELLSDQTAYDEMARTANPYGDGNACQHILDSIATAHGWTK